MKRLLLTALFAACAVVSAAGQNWTTVTASNITDQNQTKLASGQICFLGTDQNNVPINFGVGGGGQVLKRPVCATVTTGAIVGTFTVPNPANTSPSGVLYRITVKDTSTGQVVLQYNTVAFTGTAFNLDNYIPSANVVAPPATGNVTGPLNVAGNFSVTGSSTLGTITATAPLLTNTAIEQVRYADQFASLQAAINAAGSGGVVVLPSGYTATVTTPVVVSLANQTIRCDPGAKIVKGASGASINITGAGDSLIGCSIDGAQASGYTGNNVVLNGASNATISGDIITNAQGYGVYLTGVTGANITGNTIKGNLADPIFGENNTTNVVVENNPMIDASAGTASYTHAIAFHSTTAGQIVSGLTISGNRIVAGNTYCVEVGSFGGLSPTAVTVNGNTCTQGVVNGYGGYSLAYVVGGSLSNNTWYSALSNTGGIGLELVGTSAISVAGNVISGGQVNIGISVDRSSNNAIVGNIVNGWVPSGQGIHVIVAATDVLTANNNSISSNVLIFPSSAATTGIWLQASIANSDISGNTVSGNVLFGASQAGSTAVQMENDAGTMVGNLVEGNVIRNVASSFNLTGAATIGNSTIAYNLSTGVSSVFSGANYTNTTRIDPAASQVELRPGGGSYISGGITGADVVPALQIGSTSNWAIGNSSALMQQVGTLTTTAAASDVLTNGIIAAGSHCTATATNATASALTGVYLTPAAGSVTVYHSSTAGGTFAVACSVN